MSIELMKFFAEFKVAVEDYQPVSTCACSPGVYGAAEPTVALAAHDAHAFSVGKGYG